MAIFGEKILMNYSEEFETNRKTWNSKVAVHAESEFYDLENDPDEKNNVTGKYIDIEKALYNEFLKIQHKDNT
mgnify:CR=1 FL=1